MTVRHELSSGCHVPGVHSVDQILDAGNEGLILKVGRSLMTLSSLNCDVKKLDISESPFLVPTAAFRTPSDDIIALWQAFKQHPV